MNSDILIYIISFICFSRELSCLQNSINTAQYEIDLDTPPEERWKQVTKDYGQKIKRTVFDVMEFLRIKNESIEFVSALLENLDDLLPAEIAREIKGIAREGNISLGELVAYNILHELSSFCTSIVVEDGNGAVFHGRNLDFPYLTNAMKETVITVEMMRNGSLQYTAVTFAGYVGVFTGVKHGMLSISGNDRDTFERIGLLENILEMALNRDARFIGMEMRRLLEDSRIGYSEALEELQTVPLIAPCYVIIGGVNPGEGAVVTRGREAEIAVRFIDTKKGDWYVVETNYDWWRPTDGRRAAAVKNLEDIGRNKMTAKGLYQVLSLSPVCNNSTTFTAIFSAKESDVFRVEIRENENSCEE